MKMLRIIVNRANSNRNGVKTIQNIFPVQTDLCTKIYMFFTTVQNLDL